MHLLTYLLLIGLYRNYIQNGERQSWQKRQQKDACAWWVGRWVHTDVERDRDTLRSSVCVSSSQVSSAPPALAPPSPGCTALSAQCSSPCRKSLAAPAAWVHKPHANTWLLRLVGWLAFNGICSTHNSFRNHSLFNSEKGKYKHYALKIQTNTIKYDGKSVKRYRLKQNMQLSTTQWTRTTKAAPAPSSITSLGMETRCTLYSYTLKIPQSSSPVVWWLYTHRPYSEES